MVPKEEEMGGQGGEEVGGEGGGGGEGGDCDGKAMMSWKYELEGYVILEG